MHFEHWSGDRFRGDTKRCWWRRGTYSRRCVITFISTQCGRACASLRRSQHTDGAACPRFLNRDRPSWLEPSTVLLEAGDLPDLPGGWKRYVQYLEFLATDATAKRELVAERMSRGWCVGDSRFKVDMRAAAQERGAQVERFAGLEPEAVREERVAQWEEQLQALARTAKVDVSRLPPRKSDAAKTLLAAAIKASTSVSNAWLATRLDMGEPASASQFARRRMLHPAGKREVETLLSRVKT